MTMRYIFAICALTLLGPLWAQENTDVLFNNARPIEDDRYEDIKGSPYLFEVDRPADMYLTAGGVYEGVSLNYNTYTGNWEVKKGDRFLEVVEADFLTIEVTDGDQTRSFFRNLHPRFRLRFVEMIYRGSEVMVVRDFETTVATVTIQDVGATRRTKRFNNKENLVLLRRGQDYLLTGNKKKTIQALGGDKALSKFVKSEKLNLRKDTDLIRLLEYYEANFVE
jgi:hypothetical protein